MTLRPKLITFEDPPNHFRDQDFWSGAFYWSRGYFSIALFSVDLPKDQDFAELVFKRLGQFFKLFSANPIQKSKTISTTTTPTSNYSITPIKNIYILSIKGYRVLKWEWVSRAFWKWSKIHKQVLSCDGICNDFSVCGDQSKGRKY